jgi:hypothetical protein
MALLESLLLLKEVDGIPAERITAWKDALRPAVENGWRRYGHKMDGSWATRAAKEYPNADAQHAAVMIAAHLVYGDEKYRKNAEEFVRAMAEYLRPPGAWLYYLGSTPIPMYHGFELIFLGRYYQLSQDPFAAEQIRLTKDYYPYTFVPENTVEGTSTPSWKDGWNPTGGPYHAVEMVAWLAGDPYNRWFADLRARSHARHYWVAYCGEAWDAAGPDRADPLPFPDKYIIPDESIDGLRGRFGRFSFMGGRGIRITGFGSAMVADASLPSGYDGFLHLARLGISVPEAKNQPLSHSIRMFGGVEGPAPGGRVIAADHAVLAAQFEPRTEVAPEAPALNDWLVTERWLFSADGVVAAFEAVAQKDAPEGLPEGLIMLGPAGRPAALDGERFFMGNLHGRLIQTEGFGVSWSEAKKAKGLERFFAIRLGCNPPSGQVREGDSWKYAVLFSPKKDASVSVEFLSSGHLSVDLEGNQYQIGPLENGEIKVVKQ